MTKRSRKLNLHRETVAHLDSRELAQAATASGSVRQSKTYIEISLDSICDFPTSIQTVYCA